MIFKLFNVLYISIVFKMAGGLIMDLIMMSNYVKIAFRSLMRRKGFTAINIIGLAIGLAAAMLIMLWVDSQLHFDRGYPKTDRLHIVGSIGKTNDERSVYFVSPEPLAAAVKAAVPEVKQTCRLNKTRGFLFTVNEKKMIAGSGAFVDSTFMDMFQLPVLAGNIEKALNDPSNIVLTKDLALSLFGSTDNIIGRDIQIDSIELVQVAAILDEIPSNSRFAEFQYFFPWVFLEKMGFADNNWYNSSVYSFVELFPNTNTTAVQQKLQHISKVHADVKNDNFLKPIGESYLYNNYKNAVVVGGRIDMVRIFICIAVFILLIACINFVNLSTAQSEKRAKEVGVRKVVGAQRRSLIGQFLTESIALALVSTIIAILIVILLLPEFSDLIGRKLTLPIDQAYFFISILAFILLTGLLAGSYLAFFLSSFHPVRVLKGRFVYLRQKINPRKVLVVTQFVIAVVMIISTLVIRKQIQHAQQRDVGFEKENLVYVAEVGTIAQNIALIRQALLDQRIATAVTRTMSPMTERWSGWSGASWEGKDPNSIIPFNRQSADDRLIETTGLTLLKGRDFDLKRFPTDSMAAIINETAAKVMKLDQPIGSYIMDGDEKFIIIGVVKDFIQESPFNPVTPTVIEGAAAPLGVVHIKFNPELTTADALNRTEKIFKEYNPNYPFEYHFLDTEYARKFQEIQRTGKLASIFAALTIFVSCLGLFGLAAYMAESRTKEISIRKIHGASIFSVARMLSSEFVLLVSVACLIAFPIAYWAMDSYIQEYAYRISMSWELFAATGILAIGITILTVGYQSIRASLANPVDCLRDD